jgi:hypothetical protein
MSEDLQLILGTYFFQWVTLLMVILIAKKKRKILIINFGIQAAYSILFFYSFANSGPGGGILAAIVFWFVFAGIHWFTTLIHLIILLVIRSSKNSGKQKIYDTIFFIFTLESVLISLGIISGAISYGVDIGGKLMQIAILIALGLFILLKILLPKLNTKTKETVGIILTLIMLFLCFYYPMEDHFDMF